MQHLGHTRSTRQPTHLLHTPDSFVRVVLPGMLHASAIVHASPEIGAEFTQYTAEFEPEGTLGPTDSQRFVYILDGEVFIEAGDDRQTLVKDGYAYLPQGLAHRITAQSNSSCQVIEKPYKAIAGTQAAGPIISSEDRANAAPLMGDEALQVRSLLPDDPSFDFAVNTMEYQPGAALGMVEVHVMEHGLFMLKGGGIYRLGDCWYPVTAGDFIWMSPYCPQWFGALGKSAAKYLIYKNWNRSY